jgi:outer membrane protein TolC
MVSIRAIFVLISALLGGCALKPLPFSNDDLAEARQGWMARAVGDSERISKPISLYEAMARALKHNLSARVDALDAALKMRQLDLASADQLPQLVASGDSTVRNNENASSSRSVLTGEQSLQTSTSSDRQDNTADLTLSWNILDFGLSYVRTLQAGDKALISEEARRKAVHTLMRDVRTAFWKTAASDILSRRISGVSGRMRAANDHVKGLEAEGTVSPLFTLTFRRDVLELRVEIQNLYAELAPAKVQLAQLMNVNPGPDFRVAASRSAALQPARLPSFKEMSEIALQRRPELRQAGYDLRVNQREAEIALLELLPSIGPSLSVNTDTNSFLYNHDWVSAGTKASWNLMKILTYPKRKAAVEAEADYLDKKALATAVAIMTEVQVSRINYLHAREKVRIAQEFFEVESSILQQMRSSHEAGSIGEHTLMRQEMRALLAEAKRNLAYADYQNALGMLFVSMGIDVAEGALDVNLSLEKLSEVLASDWRSKCEMTLKPEQLSLSPVRMRKPG